MNEDDSGPFCRHWGDPCDCEVLCKCGHKCWEHSIFGEGYCKECDCAHFEDVETDKPLDENSL
jgi:hypothetical protein